MGPKYSDAYLPLLILSLSVLLDVCQRSSIDLLYAIFKHRFYTYLNWAEGILNLAFSLALARPFGIVGVALGTLIAAFIVRVIVQPWWVCKVSELHYVNYMRLWGGTMLRCISLMGVAIAVSAWGLRPNYPELLGSVTLAAVLYATGSWLFILNPSERKKLLAAMTNPRQDKVESNAPVAAL
jgi:O-antigen/teichoic acid export membrane protein